MNFYVELNSCKINAAALSLIYPFSDAFISKSRNIPSISDLFHKKLMKRSRRKSTSTFKVWLLWGWMWGSQMPLLFKGYRLEAVY
ncbi:unnamed protein product [Pocillopora meandrina]|uniref:Uncharacterized protein n=1 Tax=Pocillopora meandrina TaxID=46732 RepID=A0AAU9WBB5_9CNID|nr:unnamed protein product [Pocillopora meandrina]